MKRKSSVAVVQYTPTVTKMKRKLKSETLLRMKFAVSLIGLIFACTQFALVVSSSVIKKDTRKSFKNTVEYNQMHQEEIDRINAQVESGEITFEEGKKQSKKFESSTNIDKIIYEGNFPEYQYKLDISKNLEYSSWAFCCAYWFGATPCTIALKVSANKRKNEEKELAEKLELKSGEEIIDENTIYHQ